MRGAALFALTALLALAFAGAAQATNPVPNPGFETPSGDPCNTPAQWSPLGGIFGCPAPITRDTGNPHSGSASMLVEVFEPNYTSTNTPDFSACFPAQGGMYNISYWYKTDSSAAGGAKIVVVSSSTVDCKAPAAQTRQTASVTTGSWQHVTDTVTLPAGTQSAFVQLGMTCDCTSPTTMNFDDVSLEFANPTAVSVTGFRALRVGTRTILRWQTTGEAGIAGFHVFRQADGRLTRVDSRLIVATRGRQSLADPATPSGRTTYRLQAVRLDGSRAWLAAAVLR